MRIKIMVWPVETVMKTTKMNKLIIFIIKIVQKSQSIYLHLASGNSHLNEHFPYNSPRFALKRQQNYLYTLTAFVLKKIV